MEPGDTAGPPAPLLPKEPPANTMKRLWYFIPAFLVLAAILLLVLRPFRPPPVSTPLKATFVRQGLLEVGDVSEEDEIAVQDRTGRVVAQARPFGQSTVEIRFPAHPGERYRISSSSGRETIIHTPQTPTECIVRIHAPLGQEPKEVLVHRPFLPLPTQRITVPVNPLETLDLMLEVEKVADTGPIDLRLSTNAASLEPLGLRIDPPIEEKATRLEFEFDKKVWITHLTLGRDIPNEPMTLRLHVAETLLELQLFLVSQQIEEQDLTRISWHLPTDPHGVYEPHRVADQVTLPNPFWAHLTTWFRIRPATINYYEPFTFQTLSLRNESARPIGIFLTSEVLDPLSRQPVPYFAAPQMEATGGTDRVRGFAVLEPGKAIPCVLPVFLTPEVPAGTYLRRITITPLGSDKVLQTFEADLGVTRSRPLLTLWVLGITLLSLAWAIATALLYRRLVESLGVRLLVLLSLFGSLQFCLNFLGGLISCVLYAFLGPFNCLIGGLFTEVMTALLVTSTLYLVPRVGAMTLAGIVTYLMGGILFGSFAATDLLFVGSGIAFRELFLWCFQVTSFETRRESIPKGAPMILALSLADAATIFTSLALQSVFYRLFFANWYIVLQVTITGFLYTAMGVYLGQPLGRSLRRVHW
jgi:hypothetical protein